MADDTSSGYDPGFLGVAVPLPRPLGDTEIHELASLHFTVLLDPARRLAAVTAVNIDGASLQDLPRTGEWRLDPRVPARDQAGPELYAANDLDRGHLVRRRDPGWGDAAEARRATEATFFYTNAAPQASAFNQSKELWLGLEDHVLQYADSTDRRIAVFTAPVLAGDDPLYRGVRIPRRFFKVAAWVAADADGMPRLEASGFVLDQSELIDLREGVLATPRLGAFRTFQVPIADIEHLSGIDLGPLPAADVLPPLDRPADREVRGRDAWRPLRAAQDVHLG
ncbi:DNA/RNA non-specific endonuclease [Microbacterium cremeum]|uniref:DNA/RNA non-specific endonuclease n=1 Tax=Microbacterium cremeum TaxID=2782169 RepID=UPI001888C9EB|nr:DNA/RNA non-specific endonuclease [Microbacterium cremeum]